MIELKSVSKTFGDATALHPTNLDIAAGRTTALIGPSGCGKTTLLSLIVGLHHPTTGTVEIDNRTLTPENAIEMRRRMGYVIQDGGLFPHLTAARNVTLMAEHLRTPAPKIKTRLRDLCELTRFPVDGLDRFPAQLSGGQRQRVSLMRALMLDADVLLLDEPLGALDPIVRSRLQTDLKEIFNKLSKTVVLVTHDMGEAAYLGDTIVLLSEGRIVQQGSLADLRDRPAAPYVTEFMQAQRGLGAL